MLEINAQISTYVSLVYCRLCCELVTHKISRSVEGHVASIIHPYLTRSFNDLYMQRQ